MLPKHHIQPYRKHPTTTISISTTTMLKKRIHNHHNNPTNQKTQSKPKTKPKTQPPRELVHTKKIQQQPKKRKLKINLENIG
jgi:hypothetical protein